MLQLKDIQQVVARSRDRIEVDILRLKKERDQLLKRLGEQTYRLANQGTVPLPPFVQKTVERLNTVVHGIIKKQKPTKKTTTRKKTTHKKAAA